MKYRKKPIEVEAFQYLGGQYVPPWASEKGRRLAPEDRILHFWNKAHDCEMEAVHGDWIIDQGNGDRYPCKPDIFERTYEAVAERVEVKRD